MGKTKADSNYISSETHPSAFATQRRVLLMSKLKYRFLRLIFYIILAGETFSFKVDYIPQIDIQDYTYDLPQERIAQFPVDQRDRSRLLVYRKGEITDDWFYNIAGYLPGHSSMVYNKTRVIQARLQFRKETGALIEVFCLEPVEPTREIQQAFEKPSGVTWKCLVGNSKKWKEGELVHIFHHRGEKITLRANRKFRSDDHSLIEFTWDPPFKSFSEILQTAGVMPLPPYMRRDSEEADKDRYQTIYAQSEGSVAAPTAGLHFTPAVFEMLKRKHILMNEVTLHVGAGTFKPVSSKQVAGHEMHTEQIVVSLATIRALAKGTERPVIAVGTTTLRTLESLYWHGVKLLAGKGQADQVDIHQWDPYRPEYNSEIPVNEALAAITKGMESIGVENVKGQTQLMIVPGYRIRIPEILVTNFHMPQSTLLLLVAAFIGDQWKDAYRYALAHDFRFLSYGDSCLFFRNA